MRTKGPFSIMLTFVVALTLAPLAGCSRKPEVGVGTAAGAILGGLIGGGRGAAIGATGGAGAGTGVAAAQKGEQIKRRSGGRPELSDYQYANRDPAEQ